MLKNFIGHFYVFFIKLVLQAPFPEESIFVQITKIMLRILNMQNSGSHTLSSSKEFQKYVITPPPKILF